MFRIVAGGRVDGRRLASALERAERLGLSRAAYALRKAAIGGIRVAAGPSAPGTPPHTRKGLLRKAILYALEEEAGRMSAVIGPSFNIVGLAGKAHEFGGKFRDEDFDERPFMGPALSVIANRLPDFFAGTVKK